MVRLEAGFLPQLARGGLLGSFVRFSAAFDDFPRVGVECISPLAHEDDFVRRRKRDNTGRDLHFNDSVDPRLSVRTKNLVFADADPRVAINFSAGQGSPGIGERMRRIVVAHRANLSVVRPSASGVLCHAVRSGLDKTIMGWRKAAFKDQTVWVEVDAQGQPKVDGGRVPIRYQASASAKVYRAGASRVTVDEASAIEDLATGVAADASGDAKTGGKAQGKSGRGSGFGKAGTRTATQAALAADAAQKQIAALEGKAVLAFSDGACRGNPGPAGSGAYVILPDGSRWTGSKHLGKATNNIAELSAVSLVLDVLEQAGVDSNAHVAVFSDSSYTNGVLVKGWKAKANQDLIAGLKDRLQEWPKFEIIWVAGHAGIDGNERADELANRGVDGRSEIAAVN